MTRSGNVDLSISISVTTSSCNSSKCDKDFEEWYLSKDFYSEERKEKIYEYLNSMKVNMSTPCQANEKSLEGVETR